MLERHGAWGRNPPMGFRQVDVGLVEVHRSAPRLSFVDVIVVVLSREAKRSSVMVDQQTRKMKQLLWRFELLTEAAESHSGHVDWT